MTISRQPVRTHFASLLETALVGVGLPAQAVYPYLVGDFGGKTSVVAVGSGPVWRRVSDLSGCWKAVIGLRVFIFVLYADPNTGWTEQNAGDALDAIEVTINTVVTTNRDQPGYWQDIKYDESPEPPDVVAIGGVAYQRELIGLNFEVTQ